MASIIYILLPIAFVPRAPRADLSEEQEPLPLPAEESSTGLSFLCRSRAGRGRRQGRRPWLWRGSPGLLATLGAGVSKSRSPLQGHLHSQALVHFEQKKPQQYTKQNQQQPRGM